MCVGHTHTHTEDDESLSSGASIKVGSLQTRTLDFERANFDIKSGEIVQVP